MRLYRFIIWIPLIVAIGFLIADYFVDLEYVFDTSPFYDVPWILYLFLPVGFFIASKVSTDKRRRYLQYALLSPCIMAPLAVLYVWAADPGNLGMEYGGFRFFLEWLTKYPNFGPINLLIFEGICCVLLSSFLPVLFSFYCLKADLNKKISIFLLIEMIFIIPVWIKLDFILAWGATIGFASLDNIHIREMHAGIGPLFRLVSWIIMLSATISSFLKAKPSK